MNEVPEGWAVAPLGEITSINPGIDKKSIPSETTVNFVPMPAVGAGTGEIDITEVREFSKVKTGYTPFAEDDVLFAKITPCMENGKMAIVPKLPHDIAFGSTEFHVLRCPEGVLPQLIYYHVSSLGFRYEAEHKMSGAVGQKRVTEPYLVKCEMGIPPTNEQRRIVEKVETLFAEVDAGVGSLRRARALLGLYRQSVLKHAFEGKLTADWRAANPDKLEAPETLLTRIQSERDARYKQVLEDWGRAVDAWRIGGEQGRKPGKPKRPGWREIDDPSELRKLPKGWIYLPFESVAWSIRNGISAKPDEIGPLKIFRISAVRAMKFDMQDYRRITDPDGSMDDFRLISGDLVFTRYNGSRNYVGVSALYRGDGSHVYPDKLIRCEIKSDDMDSAYLEAATNCGESRAYLEKRIRTTAGQSGISGSDIKAMPVPLCSFAEQAEIVRRLDAKLSIIDAQEAEIDAQLGRADALRQSILKRAFSGKLVPQDPSDEPAAVLLAHIREQREAAPKTKRTRKTRA